MQAGAVEAAKAKALQLVESGSLCAVTSKDS